MTYPSNLSQLRIYKFWDRPIGKFVPSYIVSTSYSRIISSGPHPTAMFEVNTFGPHQTGTFFGWLVVNRGPCSLVDILYPLNGLLTDYSTASSFTPIPMIPSATTQN